MNGEYWFCWEALRLGNLHQGHSTSKALYKGENWDTETQSKLPKSPSKAELGIKSADGQEHCLHQCWTKIQIQQLCTLVLSISAIYLAELFFNTALTGTSRSVPHIWAVGKGSQRNCSSEQGPQRNLCPHESWGIFQEDIGELKYQVLKSLSWMVKGRQAQKSLTHLCGFLLLAADLSQAVHH